MSGYFVLDWAILAVSLANTILLLWLGLTVLLNAERRSWGVWTMGIGLLLGAAFFVSHTAILGSGCGCGYAGLQPQLLADAVQSGRAGQGGGLAAHDPGHRAVAVLVPGGQDRAPRRSRDGALQRSLRRKGDPGAADGSVAGGSVARRAVRAPVAGGAAALGRASCRERV